MTCMGSVGASWGSGAAKSSDAAHGWSEVVVVGRSRISGRFSARVSPVFSGVFFKKRYSTLQSFITHVIVRRRCTENGHVYAYSYSRRHGGKWKHFVQQ